MKRITVSVVVGCLFVCRVDGAAQRRPQSGSIVGEVRDSAGSAVIYVDISVRNLQRHATPDSAGRFLIADLPPGLYSLSVRSIGVQPLDVGPIRVSPGDTTRVGTLIITTDAPREVWLGCSVVESLSCTRGRRIPVPLGMIAKGEGIVRDKATWQRLWTEGHAPDVDWRREMVVLVSAGNDMVDLAGGNPARVNRVIERPDSIVVVVGPDTLVRRSRCCVDALVSPDALVIPRSEKPVSFQSVVPLNERFPAVKW